MNMSVQGSIPTEHASRYLQQLCKHWSHKLDVEFSAHHGRVGFAADAEAVFDASAAALTLTIAAPDGAMIDRLKQVVMDHLDRFAFREAPLTVHWREGDGGNAVL